MAKQKQKPKNGRVPFELSANMAIALRLVIMAYLYTEPNDEEAEALLDILPDWNAKTKGGHPRYRSGWGSGLRRSRRKLWLEAYQVEPMKRVLGFATTIPGGFYRNLVGGYGIRLRQLEELSTLDLLVVAADGED